jgi:galactose mutarotase-like enzyme
MQTLSNGILTVQVSESGAELQSIKKNGHEYLWQGDPAFWGRRSPVLFPIVGSVWEKKYRVSGNVYEMGQHGFARDAVFTLMSVSDNEVWYRMEYSEATLQVYPWKFILEIGYRLSGNSIEVLWKVTNPSDEEIFFQIGAHPAFNYPDYDAQKPERGYFVLDKTEGLQCVRIKEKGCVDAESKYPLTLVDGAIPLDWKTYDEIDTFVLQDSQVSRVSLLRPDKSPYLTVTFDESDSVNLSTIMSVASSSVTVSDDAVNGLA